MPQCAPPVPTLVERWRRGEISLQEVLAHARELDAGDLVEVLAADQEERWRNDDRLPVEQYLQQHPILLATPDALLDLVYGECLLRKEFGEAPTLAEYLERFPQIADGLQQLYEEEELPELY